jgi:hypothetical protein
MTKQTKKGVRIPRHSDPIIETALAEARKAEWLANYPAAHWGVIYCAYGHTECRISVNVTPAVPESHARQIVRKVMKCPGQASDDPQTPTIGTK